jgi:hypothetical protein
VKTINLVFDESLEAMLTHIYNGETGVELKNVRKLTLVFDANSTGKPSASMLCYREQDDGTFVSQPNGEDLFVDELMVSVGSISVSGGERS